MQPLHFIKNGLSNFVVSLIRIVTWRPKIPRDLDPPLRWRYKQADWVSVCNFAGGLRWKCEDGASFAFCELGILFHQRGFRIVGDYDTITIHAVVCVIRQAFQYLAKNDNVQPFPGYFDPRHVNVRGKFCVKVPSSMQRRCLLMLNFWQWQRL